MNYFLERSNLFLSYYTDDFIPYDDLIMKFTSNSGGKFKDVLVDVEIEEDTTEQTDIFTIKMVFKEKVFVYVTDHWHDVEFVDKLINTALSESGISRRFISVIFDMDISHQFLFAKQEQVDSFLKKYLLRRY